MWGAEDLSASLGATEKASGGVFPQPYRLARDLCLMAAAGAEVAPIDTVYTDIDNLAGLELETRAARRDGFSAKALIHPKHVDVVNAAFAPTDAERAWAEKVIAALRRQSQFRHAAARWPDDRQAASARRAGRFLASPESQPQSNP